MSELTKLSVETYNFNETVLNYVGNSRSCSNIDNWNNDFQSHVTVDYVFSDQGVNLEHYTNWPITEGESADIYPFHFGVGFVPLNFTNMDLTRASYLCHSCIFNFDQF